MKFDQKRFQQYFVKEIPLNELTTELLDHISPVGKLSSTRALEAYHNDYIARLTEALGDFYESVWMVIGDEEFFKLAKEYILMNPSKSFDLGVYGEKFPLFLKNSLLSQEFPFLEDLGELEKDFLSIFHQRKPNSMIFTPDQLSRIDQLRIKFTPSLILKQSSHPIVSIWKCKNQDLSYDDINFNDGEQYLIYKSPEGAFIKVLTPKQFLILESLLSCDTVQQSLSKVEEEDSSEENPEQIQKLFQFMMESGIIEDVS